MINVGISRRIRLIVYLSIYHSPLILLIGHLYAEDSKHLSSLTVSATSESASGKSQPKRINICSYEQTEPDKRLFFCCKFSVNTKNRCVNGTFPESQTRRLVIARLSSLQFMHPLGSQY
jgi:hypothetical protein